MNNETNQSKEQTKKCSKCGEEILASAKKCKHCQTDLRNWFARHKVITVVFIFIVLILVMISSKEEKEDLPLTRSENGKIIVPGSPSTVQSDKDNIDVASKPINEPLEEEVQEIPEDIYKARIFSEGEKLSQAGLYLNQASNYLDLEDYDSYDEYLYEASGEFKSVKWTFEGQKIPPTAYASFNENMINIFSNIIDVIENDLTIDNLMTDGYNVDQIKFNKAIAEIGELITEANEEMTKVGF
jgi:hypothetical protein